jgi:hypothetical protein
MSLSLIYKYLRMGIKRILLLLIISGSSLFCAAQGVEYVVVAGKGVAADQQWYNVAKTLQSKHHAVLITYQKDLEEILPELKKYFPRYVALVEKPETVGREYVRTLSQLARNVDDDIYADFLWGIITGYDASAAMRMVENSVKPLVIKNAISTITELKSGKWFDKYGYIDDHAFYVWGEKQSPNDAVKTSFYSDQGKDVVNLTLKKFEDLYCQYDPDLIVTASHASQKNLEMPHSFGNVKCKDGKLYLDYPGGPVFLPENKQRIVYMPIGNCLIGDVNNTKNSMAIAWMNSGNATAMLGYTVTTWYGRAGWGALKYWLSAPGRMTLAEAAFLNQQDMLTQISEWNKKLPEVKFSDINQDDYSCASNVLSKVLGKPANRDQIGFMYDRDVLAYYGDPAWNVRLQNLPFENDYKVSMMRKGKKCIISVITGMNFSMERMKGDHFKQEHVLDLPFSYFFPQRLKNPRLENGQSWKCAMDENFLMVYNANFMPGKTYRIVLDVD